ncbi:MAG: hypothetical protein IE914_00320 [Thiotrichales bacterium]|nr:hypothetical protein [Thiotrichales bacterium]
MVLLVFNLLLSFIFLGMLFALIRNARKLAIELRKYRFFHSVGLANIRFYLKVFSPHPFYLLKRYHKAFRKKLPKFYSYLSAMQVLVLTLAALQLIKDPLRYAVNSDQFKNHYLVTSGKLVQAGCYKSQHKTPCALELQGENGKKFYVRYDNLPKSVFNTYEVRHYLGSNVVVEYINLPKTGANLLSLEVSPDSTYIAPRKTLLRFDQSVKAYSSTSLDVYIMYLLVYLFLSWWKYRQYGLRDYFKVIEHQKPIIGETELNTRPMWLRCPKNKSSKPSKEMMGEATRIAFFADEVLSQEITDSCEKTLDYIDRHTEIHRAKLKKSPMRHYHRTLAQPISASRLFILTTSTLIIIWALTKYL